MKELTEEQQKAVKDALDLLDSVGLVDCVIVPSIGAPRPHRPK
jgi:hypothetical protein